MLDALDLDRRNGRAFDRREQRPPQGIAYSCTEAAFERLGRESPVAVGQRFAVSRQTTRHLKASPEIVLVHNLPLENLGKNHAAPERALQSRGLRSAPKLLTIKFHDQLFVDRTIDIFSRRQRGDRRAHFRAPGRDPGGTAAPRRRLPCALDVRVLAARFFHADNLAGLYLVRRDINLPSVHEHMSVIYELASLPP